MFQRGHICFTSGWHIENNNNLTKRRKKPTKCAWGETVLQNEEYVEQQTGRMNEWKKLNREKHYQELFDGKIGWKKRKVDA